MNTERNPELDLSELLAVLVDRRWRLIGAMTVALALGAAYLFLAAPEYRSDALIHIEPKPSGLPEIGELSELLEGSSEVATEIEIVRSRSVIGAVVDELRLSIQVTPVHFPLLGPALARRFDEPGLADPWPGLERFAWGGERMEVERFDVPPFLHEQPVQLQVLEDGAFRLAGPDGAELASGAVGELVDLVVDEPDGGARRGRLALQVSRLEARPGTAFELTRFSRAATIETLRQALEVHEMGRDTSILRLSLQGHDPDRVLSTLDALAQHYVRYNTARRSAEAEHMLEFTRNQLPRLRANLDAAEHKLNTYRTSKGSVDVSLEIQAILEKVAEVEGSISRLELERTELRRRFTGSHPRLMALDEKLARLRAERSELEGDLKVLPETEWDTVRLMRDVKVASELYVLLLNRAQELSVLKAGAIGNAWVLDPPARPEEPVAPDPPVIIVQALLAGLAAGLVLVFGGRLLRRTLDDPDRVERITGLPVYATVTHSRAQRRLVHDGAPGLLVNTDPGDIAVEGLRSLRTALQFASAEDASPVVCISGPVPAVGKSFVSANLAALVAAADRKVLVIDADLRKGHLHDAFSLRAAPGLSEVLNGTVPWRTAVQLCDSGLHLLTAGTPPPNPAELLLSGHLPALLRQARDDYDLILVDTPPVLPVTDACLLARHCNILLLVLRSECHTEREVHRSIQQFARSGLTVNGLVFNGLRAAGALTGYGYGYGYGYAGATPPAARRRGWLARLHRGRADGGAA